MRAKSFQLRLTLCNCTDCSPPGSSVHEFSRQEYWNGLPCPPPGHLPKTGNQPTSLTPLALAGGLWSTSATWEPPPRCQTPTKEVLLAAVYLSLNKETKTNTQRPPNKDISHPFPLGLKGPYEHCHSWAAGAAQLMTLTRGGWGGGCEDPAPLHDAARQASRSPPEQERMTQSP